ncbi:MAG: hypothetical protein Kow0031_22420 [Anaerolineae bacterium]
MAVTMELAISAIRAGRKQEGRQLLNLLIQQDPNNEIAWLWMSQVVDTDEQRARCLYHVLALNPESQPARRGLQLLGIVVTDSRPVKLPPDLQRKPARQNGTAALPSAAEPPEKSETNGDASRRPFLLDPDTITKELPFEPVKKPPAREPVQASPAILSLKVDDDEPSPPEASDTPAPAQQPVDSVEPAAAAIEQPAQPEAGETESAGKATGTSAIAGAAVAAQPIVEPAVAATPDEKPAAGEADDQKLAKKAHSTGPIILPIVAGAASLAVATAASSETDPTPPAEPAEAAVAGAVPPPVAAAPAPPQNQPVAANTTEDPATTTTQKMASPFEQTQPAQPAPVADLPTPTLPPPPQTDSTPVTAQPAPPQINQPAPGSNIPPDAPLETRQSQPVLINYPMPNAGFPQDGQMYYPSGPQPGYNQPGQYPNQNYYPAPAHYHNSATMGMPMLPAGHYNRPPSEPVPPLPAGNGLFSGQQLPPGMSLHSSATMMMPTMSEAEARARLASSQAIPTANAAAMPLQNGGSWPQPPGFAPAGYSQEYHDFDDDDEEEDGEGEINILAVIIFGTLSITALGGLGMLVLLILTTSTTTI